MENIANFYFILLMFHFKLKLKPDLRFLPYVFKLINMVMNEETDFKQMCWKTFFFSLGQTTRGSHSVNYLVLANSLNLFGFGFLVT